jgi:hypothetical protein
MFRKNDATHRRSDAAFEHAVRGHPPTDLRIQFTNLAGCKPRQWQQQTRLPARRMPGNNSVSPSSVNDARPYLGPKY